MAISVSDVWRPNHENRNRQQQTSKLANFKLPIRENNMKLTKLTQALISIGVIGLLSACGGGGGSGSASTTPATPATGTVNMALTDGPSDTVNHVWVTVKSISFHTSADQVWSATDATWQNFPLATPITLDLASLNNGAMNTVFAGLNLQPGSYKQIRFFFAGANDNLSSSAIAIKDNETTPTPLQWNDQVEYTDSTGTTIMEAPLVIAYPTQGMQLKGTFNVVAGGTLNLVTDFDLDKIIVPYEHGGKQSFTMRPNLTYFDLSSAGAISGSVASVCPAHTASATCAYNLIVHAEAVTTADPTRHTAIRSTSVDPTTGNFMLFPVPLKDSSGNALSYDLVIRGRQMETMIVTGIKPTGTNQSGAAVVQTAALAPVINTSEYGANLATPLSLLTGGYAIFQQTLPTPDSTLPYEVRWSNTDPFTGKFDKPFPLENAPVHVAPYNNGSALAFTTTVPGEGIGGYSVVVNETMYYSLSSIAAINAPLGATTTIANLSTFTAALPTLNTSISGLMSGSVTGTVAITSKTSTSYPNATLVISSLGTIVTSVPISNGTFTINNLPAGVPGAYYYAYVDLGTTATDGSSIFPVNGMIDLRTSTSASGFNVSVAAP
jgi:hypothetical protein